jgi:DNA-binding NarL/FixJ family response regulator
MRVCTTGASPGVLHVSASMLSKGLTTSHIAKQLVISPRTADAHLRSIYSELEVISRAAATRSAIEHKLI